jgi:hypothetical protein
METLYWLINTQTIGGLFVLVVFGTVLTLYFVMVRWIIAGAQVTQDDHSTASE